MPYTTLDITATSAKTLQIGEEEIALKDCPFDTCEVIDFLTQYDIQTSCDPDDIEYLWIDGCVEISWGDLESCITLHPAHHADRPQLVDAQYEDCPFAFERACMMDVHRVADSDLWIFSLEDELIILDASKSLGECILENMYLGNMPNQIHENDFKRELTLALWPCDPDHLDVWILLGCSSFWVNGDSTGVDYSPLDVRVQPQDD